jgi:hypothetical protein
MSPFFWVARILSRARNAWHWGLDRGRKDACDRFSSF